MNCDASALMVTKVVVLRLLMAGVNVIESKPDCEMGHWRVETQAAKCSSYRIITVNQNILTRVSRFLLSKCTQLDLFHKKVI